MSLLLGPPREARADRPTNSLYELLRRRESPVDAGVHVDADTAARHGAVFACCDLISRLASTLPVHEFRRSGQASVQLTTPQVLISPDGELDISAWLYQVLDSLLKRGNAYGLIERYDLTGWPTQIKIVHPDAVTCHRRGRTGPMEWELEGTPIGKWPNGDLWHLSAYTVAGSPIGLSPIGYAAQTIGVGLGAQRFGAMWFRDGAVPAGLLTNEAEVPKELANLVTERWLDSLMGNREPVVLGDGWKYDQISIAPEESQFLDTMQANVADVARFFGVEPEAIGGTRSGGSSVVYQNVEQSEIHLLVRTINPWIVRIERALTALRPRPRFVKLNPDALLRVDTMTRVKSYDVAVRGGWRSPDEVRALEDLPPIPDDKGDRMLWPPGRMQLTEAELAEGSDAGSTDDVAPGGDERSPNEDVLELASALQKIYLAAVNGVITNEEAREIVNRMGANLPIQLPVAVGTNGSTPNGGF